MGQSTSSTSEEVAELRLESISFVIRLSHLSTVLQSDYPFCVARKKGGLGDDLGGCHLMKEKALYRRKNSPIISLDPESVGSPLSCIANPS